VAALAGVAALPSFELYKTTNLSIPKIQSLI
jgi:hypothetical protein